MEICAEFYRKLYQDIVQNITKTKAEEVPPILACIELERALSQISSKAPGKDQVVVEMIRSGEKISLKKIQGLFNAVLVTETVPKEWKNAIIILICKIGDMKDFAKYRPISLVSHIYKLLSETLK